MLGKPLWIAAAVVAAAAFAAAPALADQVFHTTHAAVHAVAGAPLQSGFVNDIHSNGTVNSAHEEYHLNGAQPNTTYQVQLVIYPTTNCTGAPFLVFPTSQLTTNGSGGGKLRTRCPLRKGGFTMTAAILRRKLRNFPVANLTERIWGD